MKQPKLFLLLSALLLVAALMLLFTNGQRRSTDDEAATLTNKQLEETAPRPQLVKEFQDSPVKMRLPAAAEVESNKIAILDQIFEAKNDNDPRMDTAFNHLTPEEKRTLESKYLNYKKEALNERGTIIFLLGKNVQESNDLLFLKEVLQESPCASLANCHSNLNQSSTDDHKDTNDLTLAYPQVMALRSLKEFLIKSSGGESLKQLATDILAQSVHSPSDMVKDYAQLMMDEVKRKTH